MSSLDVRIDRLQPGDVFRLCKRRGRGLTDPLTVREIQAVGQFVHVIFREPVPSLREFQLRRVRLVQKGGDL